MLALFLVGSILGPAARQAHARLDLGLVAAVRLALGLVVALRLTLAALNLAPSPAVLLTPVLMAAVNHF